MAEKTQRWSNSTSNKCHLAIHSQHTSATYKTLNVLWGSAWGLRGSGACALPPQVRQIGAVPRPSSGDSRRREPVQLHDLSNRVANSDLSWFEYFLKLLQKLFEPYRFLTRFSRDSNWFIIPSKQLEPWLNKLVHSGSQMTVADAVPPPSQCNERKCKLPKFLEIPFE